LISQSIEFDSAARRRSNRVQRNSRNAAKIKRDYLSSLLPIAGDVQARLVRQPNDAAAVGIHFINVGVSGAAAEDNTL
jgi:hypothetical protein